MPPLTSYKYTSPSNALRCLEDNILYFAKAEELNDRLELKHIYATPEEYMNAISTAYSQLKEKHHYDYSYDFSVTSEFIESYNAENSRFKNYLQTIGICSTTKTPHNHAMWGIYAKEGYGVCFEMEWRPAILSKYQIIPSHVIYNNDPRIHNRGDFYAKELHKISNENPDYCMEEIMACLTDSETKRRVGIQCTASVAAMKREEWSYENEVRLISPHSGAKSILSDVLTRVHFMDFHDHVTPLQNASAQKRHESKKYLNAILPLLYTDYPAVELVNWQFKPECKDPISTSLNLSSLSRTIVE